jgi:hypothetical protein
MTPVSRHGLVRVICVIPALMLLTMSAGSASASGQAPDGRVLKVTQSAEIYTDAQGNADAGYEVQAVVQNRGGRATFVVTATLSCSEGEWKRSRTIILAQEATEIVSFAFPQPTLSATDIRSLARIEIEH